MQPAFHETGTIVDDGTKVLTCSHCIDSNSQTYVVVDTLVLPAKTVYEDKKNDIAILELIGYIGTPLSIKKNHGLLIGNEIFTIGFPYDAYSAKTLTIGHLAAFEGDVLKINCAVNNGNSGGPFLNMNGEVVGVINAKLGRFSSYLESVKNASPKAYMSISGIDPVATIQRFILEMERT